MSQNVSEYSPSNAYINFRKVLTESLALGLARFLRSNLAPSTLTEMAAKCKGVARSNSFERMLGFSPLSSRNWRHLVPSEPAAMCKSPKC